MSRIQHQETSKMPDCLIESRAYGVVEISTQVSKFRRANMAPGATFALALCKGRGMIFLRGRVFGASVLAGCLAAWYHRQTMAIWPRAWPDGR